MRIRATNIKLRINESTFSSVKNVIKKGDVLSVVKDKNKFNYTITDIRQTPSGVLYVLHHVFKSNGKEFNLLFDPRDFNNGVVSFTYLKEDNNTKKFSITDVKLINLIRNNKVIEVIDGLSNDTKDDDKNKDLNRQKEETLAFKEEISKAKPGDLLVLSTGESDKNGNIKRNTITDLNFNVESLSDNKIYLSVNSIEGKDNNRYKELSNWEDIIINDKSYRFNKNSATVVLELLGGGKSDIYSIDNIFSFEVQAGAGEITNDKTPGESEEDLMAMKRKEAAIMKNPRLIKALVGNRSLLRKVIGKKREQGFTGILKRLQSVGNIVTKMKPGSKVLFTLLGEDIKGESISLIKGKTYEASVINPYTLIIKIQNNVERVIIDITGELDSEDTFSVICKLQKVEKKEVINEKTYKSEILINRYKYNG